MKPRTINALHSILGMYGFITTERDMLTLMADDRTRSRKVIIRCHNNRHVLPLNDALDVIDEAAQSGMLRDVAFTSTECEALRKELSHLA